MPAELRFIALRLHCFLSTFCTEHRLVCSHRPMLCCDPKDGSVANVTADWHLPVGMVGAVQGCLHKHLRVLLIWCSSVSLQRLLTPAMCSTGARGVVRRQKSSARLPIQQHSCSSEGKPDRASSFFSSCFSSFFSSPQAEHLFIISSTAQGIFLQSDTQPPGQCLPPRGQTPCGQVPCSKGSSQQSSCNIPISKACVCRSAQQQL